MASAAPSPLASSVEKTNGAKLSRLLIDGGTTVLRSILNTHYPPASLSAAFNAKYSTLIYLLRRRILHRPQWDLLFPPSGTPPDSQTFDITLLFLLLTNICGLSPPHSGWHTKPLSSDRSFEANLARIKFYRNELYGHVTTTGIADPAFSTLWQEISAVLVALGLQQAEIDRLKAEHCGEQEFIDALLEWADTEEDIKSQLKDIRDTQTKVLETVDIVQQTQLRDHEAFHKSKAKLENVHQLQMNLQESVSIVHQSQLQGIRAIEDTKSNVEKIGERLQTLEDVCHETIQNSRSEKKSIRNDEDVLSKLAKIDSFSDIRHHTSRYLEGTRLPIFEKIEKWLDDIGSPNRVMVISGNAGMGKSVISAVFCQKMLKAGRLSGWHFCQHNKARRRNPKVMLQSLACQLSDSFPAYRKTLVKKLSRNLGVDINDMKVDELFELLFEESLEGMNDPGSTHLMVIDGLDESEYQGRNELLNVVADYFKTLPHWIRFVVTTRPEMNISEKLQELNPIQLKPDDRENLKDIRLCFQENLEHILESDCQETILEKLVEKSEGVMLYTYYLTEFIKKNTARMGVAQLINSGLPSGISSVYQDYFNRLKTELQKEVGITEVQFFDFLNAIVAAREPLPVDFACKLFFSKEWSSTDEQKVRDAMDCISALLPIEGECINFFHKSVKDWLIEKSTSRQKKFTVNERECHRVISKLCIDELDGLKLKGIRSLAFEHTTRYALQHGVQHTLEVEENARPRSFDEIVKNYVLDFELVYAKLSVNNTAAIEDVLCVQEKGGIDALSRNYQRALKTVLFLLRKHLSTLSKIPHAIFQTFLNEGGLELSAEAFSLLNTEYAELPYMEYLQKKEQEEDVVMQFRTLTEVACFDISPDSDYLVCECKGGKIYLWSLRTTQLLWERDVQVPKIYEWLRDPMEDDYVDLKAYRGEEYSYILSLHRSVIFHPSLYLILPGVLSQAYTISGDLKPLFLTSKCCFNVCSVSEDQTSVLTDCPDNANCIIQWSLNDGKEITRLTHERRILSFAWSRNGRWIAISDSGFCISLCDALDGFNIVIQTYIPAECGMLKLTPDGQFLFGYYHPPDEDFPFISWEFMRLCFNLRRDSDEKPNSFQILEMPLHQLREFESCNERGFLFGDPFWYPLSQECSFFHRDEITFALVLNEKFVLRSSPSSNIIEMISIDERKTEKVKPYDEAKYRSELNELAQRTEVEDSPDHGTELDDIPHQMTKLDDVLEQRIEIDNGSEEKTELSETPEQTAGLKCEPKKEANRQDLPAKKMEISYFPEKGAKWDDLKKHIGELCDALEQRTEVKDVLEQGMEPNEQLAPYIYSGDSLGDAAKESTFRDQSEINDAYKYDDLSNLERFWDQAEINDTYESDDLSDSEREEILSEDEGAVWQVKFSVDGDTLYVVKRTMILRINITTGDILSKMVFRAGIDGTSIEFLPFKRGVLLVSDIFREFWNSELSVCIQRWPYSYNSKFFPSSEELVALQTCNLYERKLEVTFHDTTSGDIVSIIHLDDVFSMRYLDGVVLACSSKCEVLTRADENSLQLRCDNMVLWSKSLPSGLTHICPPVLFSPTGQYFVISGREPFSFKSFYMCFFGRVSGKVISQLKWMQWNPFTCCEFISDEECIVGFRDRSRGYCLRLYNVNSGDLLTEIVEERHVECFAACPRKRLVAISFENFEVNFEIIQVKLPGHKEKKNNKRLKLPK